MSENLNVYIPRDRRQALAESKPLSDRAMGTALFADISGFTVLTEALALVYGPKRGAEELIKHLNRVYDAAIAPVEKFGGSVIGFSGDAMTCWFNEDDGLRALASAFEIQATMQQFLNIVVSPQQSATLSIKIAVVAGPVRRFLIGDPTIHYIDVIAGATLDRLAASEHQADRREVVIDENTASQLAEMINIREWRTEDGARFAVVGQILPQHHPQTIPVQTPSSLDDDQIRCWILPDVYERLKRGQSDFLAELRWTVPIFVKFSGIDYDHDEAAEQKLDAYIRWVQSIFARYAGTLLHLIIGDKGSYLCGTFGAPVSHSDDSLRAVTAVQELIQPPSELAFITNVQIGVSTGRMYTGPYGGTTRRTYSIIGDETNVAARLMQQAEPGQVILSGSVAQAVEQRYQLNPLGAIYVKGKTKPIDIFSLVGSKSNLSFSNINVAKPRSLLVGRQDEQAVLQDQLNQLIDAGHSQTLIIEGDAGIGKSHLVERLIEQAHSAGATCLFGAGDAIDQTTLYYAWQPIFSQLLGLDRLADDPNTAPHSETRRNHVLSWLNEANDALAQLAPLFSAMAPLDIPDNETTSLLSGQVRAETTREFLTQIIEHQAQTTNLVIILDDVFWVDSSSWALIKRVAALNAAVMLVLVTRPFRDNAPQEYEQIVNLPTTTRLALGPLGEEDAIALVKQRLGATKLPTSVVSFIQERAEGNPFFSEEIAYALRDAGFITIRDDVCELAPHLPDLLQIDFPNQVEDVIVSRIDRLTAAQQLALKIASVVGRIFAYRTLSDIHPVPEDIPHLVEYLDVLAKVDLTPLDIPNPDLTYRFKHIITQEVAYNLMLFEQRRKLHQTIGEWFEANYSPDLPNYYSILAYHWHKVADDATASPEIISKAIDYLAKAADQAVQNYANPEATKHLKNALSLLERLPPSLERDQRELSMQTMYAYSLVTERGYGDPDVETAYHRAHLLSEVTQENEQLGFIVYGIFSFHSSRAEYEPGDRLADRLLDIGNHLDDKPIQAIGQQSKGIIAFCQGNPEAALAYAQKSYEIAAPLDSAAFFQFGGDFQAYTSSWITLSNMLLGYPERAQTVYEQALTLTEKQPYPHCFILGFACIPQLKNDPAETIKRAEELVSLSERYSFVLLALLGNIYRAWVLATVQTDPVGVQTLEEITPVPKFVKLDSFVPWYLSLLAQAQSIHGKQEDALQSIDEALTYAEAAGGNFYQAEAHRLKGDILYTQAADPDAIERQYRQAIDIARQQKAKWWELRAAVSLAKWLKVQGQLASARELLSPIYNWFTEGFELPDLLEAKSLLAEL